MQQFDWINTVCKGAKEQLAHDAPPPFGKLIVTVSYKEANLMHDMLTGTYVTGILHFVNQTPFDWYAKNGDGYLLDQKW